jgi:hypothetical protein
MNLDVPQALRIMFGGDVAVIVKTHQRLNDVYQSDVV